MATLSVLRFSTPDGAQKMESTLLELQRQHLIEVQDAAIVTWPLGKTKPQTKQLRSLVGQGALTGAFWGMLFGLLFFVPFFGLAVGAAIGVLSGKFADYGIDDNFIKQTREKVTEGTSALFLLTARAVQDKVVEAMQGQTFEILSTSLSKEKEDELRAAFGVD
ncbi:MAG TPA: DUF1269 domain-containing protein [Anaerolineae bacterium]|nr:DUF1269 domain-containing protein [Anaerolineae bacterium]